MKNYLILLYCLLLSTTACTQSVKYLSSAKELKSHRSSSQDEIVFIPGKKGGYFKPSKKSGRSAFKNTPCGTGDGWERIIPNDSELNVLWFGADDEDQKDDTQFVQCAIDALPKVGGKVIIPLGCRFRLKDLRFSQRTVLEYHETSDISGDAGTTKVTNEVVYFLANANKAGIVNEQIMAAPFHPGFLINVKKNVMGQEDFLGKDQSMDNPVRASFIIQDEGLGQVIQQYMAYPDYNIKYSGWRLGLQRNTYRLEGVSITDFPKQPKIGDLIESKNGKGHLVEHGNGYLVVQWFSGRFQKGDQLFTGSRNRTRKTLSNAKMTSKPFNALSLNRENGYVGIGIPNSNALQPLTVGGRIGIQRSRLHGQYIPEEIINPAIVFANSFEAENPMGVQLSLATNGQSKGRLVLTDYQGKKETANVGAIALHTSFNKSTAVTPSSFNTRTIERVSTGVYWVYFKNPVEQKNYQVTLGTSHPLEFAYCDLQEKNRFRVKVVKTGTTRPVDPTGNISVICAGGY